jgi:hypothetical protein
MNLEPNIFSHTISKTIHFGTNIISLWLLLLREESLYPRKVYFSRCKVHLGMTSGVQNEFRAQYFQPYYPLPSKQCPIVPLLYALLHPVLFNLLRTSKQCPIVPLLYALLRPDPSISSLLQNRVPLSHCPIVPLLYALLHPVPFNVGMAAGVQNEFRTEYFHLYYFENHPFGNHYYLALALITLRIVEALMKKGVLRNVYKTSSTKS